MMKSFFKKLAFVMALAMVVSLAAPAATTASAAEEMKIAYQNGAVITELNLTEARSSEDLKAKDAPSNWKELGINWVSSNPAVATVDNAGVVTAVSAGTADIMVTCGDATATITVNCFADAKAYDVTIGTADERSITEKTLKVGGEFDFAFFGVKDYGRDKVNNAPRYFCEWDSTDTAVATVDKNGLVKAVAPGKAKITLIVWNLATGTKHNVTPTWVTVAADATPTPVAPTMEVAQKSEYKAELTFNNLEVTKEGLEAGLKVFYNINDNRVELPVYVKEVKENVADVRSYTGAPFVEGVTYTYVYGDTEAAFEAYIGTPTSIKASYECTELEIANKAYTNYNTKIITKILNDKGIDITDTAMKSSTASIELTVDNEAFDACFVLDAFNKSIYFTQAGKVAKINITYYTGEVDSTTGLRVIGAKTVLPIVSEAAPAYTMIKLTSTKLSDESDSITLSLDEKVAVADHSVSVKGNKTARRSLWLEFTDTEKETVKNYGTDYVTDSRLAGHFSYKSTSDSVVSVDPNGTLTPNAPGTANILVYYDTDLLDTVGGTVVAVIPVTVYGNRVVTTVTADKVSSLISTDAGEGKDVATGLAFNQVKITVKAKDQLDDAINALWNTTHPTEATLVCNNTFPKDSYDNYLVQALKVGTTPVTSAGVSIAPLSWEEGTYEIILNADPTTLAGVHYNGGYTYSFTLYVDNKAANFSVTVKDPVYDTTTGNGAVTSNIVNQGYELAVSGDDQVSSWTNDDKTAKVAYYKVSNGVRYGIVAMQSELADAGLPGTYYRINKLGVNGTLNHTVEANADNANGVDLPLARRNVAYTDITSPAGLNVLNKSYNGKGTYSVTVYTRTATGAALKFAAQKSFVVNDWQQSLVYTGKQANFYSVANNSNLSLEAIVKKCFSFQYDGWHNLKKASDYNNFDWAGHNVAIQVVGNYSDGTNVGSVAYIEKVYFYVPTNAWNGVFYVRYELPINDYVVLN